MNLLVAVALTDDAPAALLQIARPPRAVQVVERDEPVLHLSLIHIYDETRKAPLAE